MKNSGPYQASQPHKVPLVSGDRAASSNGGSKKRHPSADLTGELRGRTLSARYPLPDHEVQTTSCARKVATLLGAALLISVPCVLAYYQRKRLERLGDWLIGMGAKGTVLYFLLIVVWTLLCLPVTPLEVTAGLLYPYWLAWLVTLAGQVIGSLGSFLIGRHILRGWLYVHCVRRYSFARRLRAAFKSAPRRCALLLCFSYSPLYIHNFALAVLPCSLPTFLGATTVSSAVFSATWTAVGASARSVVAAVDDTASYSYSSSSAAAAHVAHPPTTAHGAATAAPQVHTGPELLLMGVGLLVAGAILVLVQRQAASELAHVGEGSPQSDASLSPVASRSGGGASAGGNDRGGSGGNGGDPLGSNGGAGPMAHSGTDNILDTDDGNGESGERGSWWAGLWGGRRGGGGGGGAAMVSTRAQEAQPLTKDADAGRGRQYGGAASQKEVHLFLEDGGER